MKVADEKEKESFEAENAYLQTPFDFKSDRLVSVNLLDDGASDCNELQAKIEDAHEFLTQRYVIISETRGEVNPYNQEVNNCLGPNGPFKLTGRNGYNAELDAIYTDGHFLVAISYSKK